MRIRAKGHSMAWKLPGNSNKPERIKSEAISTLPEPAWDGNFCFSSIVSGFMIDGPKIGLTCMLPNTFRVIAGRKTDECRMGIGESGVICSSTNTR